MKRLVTTMFALVCLVAATSAFALDIHSRTPMPTGQRAIRPLISSAMLSCDDGVEYNAYYQATDSRYGNLFDFGTSSKLSTVSFTHFGYGFSGPYNYNIEVWDPTSCTLVASRLGLQAGDAADVPATETVNLCDNSIILSGTMVVTIDPNSCLAPTDCYPDVMTDDQTNVFCPVVVQTASTTPGCFDLSPYGGPFLLRIELNNCGTPVHHDSWGHMKSIYR